MQELFLKTVEKTFTKKSTKARRRKRGWFTQDQMAKKLMWSKLLSCSQALILPNSYSESLSGSLWFSCFFSLSLSLSRSLSLSLALSLSLFLSLPLSRLLFHVALCHSCSPCTDPSLYLSISRSRISLSLSLPLYIYILIYLYSWLCWSKSIICG